MNKEREEEEEERRCCLLHPKELVIGICALCLKERLSSLLLANSKHNKKHKIRLLPKIFAITSLINPLDIKHHKSDQVYDDDDDDDDNDDTFFSSTTSHEDSFISIKFEDNGVGSWDKGKSITKDNQINSLKLENEGKMVKSLVGHFKPRATLRWRKRIGHLLHLTGWKSKGNNNNNNNNLEGVKVKRGWIRILTKRRTKE